MREEIGPEDQQMVVLRDRVESLFNVTDEQQHAVGFVQAIVRER